MSGLSAVRRGLLRSLGWLGLAEVVRPDAARAGDVVPPGQSRPSWDGGTPPRRGPLAFVPGSLPGAAAGKPYQAEISIERNETPVYQIAVAEGALPPGLVLKYDGYGTRAQITGVPSTPGAYSFTVVARCQGTMVMGQEGRKDYVIKVA